ncbi:MAG TPA: prepilin-type N-terminal cleavage/methylation domain-containing protein [Phycisphaerae bacterium]|nr:prepilin-type N-terminal cleavage/methylation domain-containing protein [Phycisphaerae bacterium]
MTKQKTGPSCMKGFTLVEVLVASVLVAIGVTSLLAAMATSTQSNTAGRDLAQGALLCQEIREWTLGLPLTDPDPESQDNPPGPDGSDPQTFVDDLDDLLGVTFSPPRDASGLAITDMDQWSQTINITWRKSGDVSTTVLAGSSDVVYVEVVISRLGNEVCRTGWIVANKE